MISKYFTDSEKVATYIRNDRLQILKNNNNDNISIDLIRDDKLYIVSQIIKHNIDIKQIGNILMETSDSIQELYSEYKYIKTYIELNNIINTYMTDLEDFKNVYKRLTRKKYDICNAGHELVSTIKHALFNMTKPEDHTKNIRMFYGSLEGFNDSAGELCIYDKSIEKLYKDDILKLIKHQFFWAIHNYNCIRYAADLMNNNYIIIIKGNSELPKQSSSNNDDNNNNSKNTIKSSNNLSSDDSEELYDEEEDDDAE